jgi:hypothetical protein
MDNNTYSTEDYLSPHVLNPLHDTEGVGLATDPLALDIPDDDLVEIIDRRIEQTRHFYKEKYDLYTRRQQNETFLFGRQIAELEAAGKLKDYESRNLDNILYEIEATIKPLAMSQLPDMLVTPGQETDESREVAELLTMAVNSDVRKRKNRYVLGLAFKHNPTYYVGVIKCRWNPQLAGGMGDYEYIVIHPELIDFDHTATEPDADMMKYVSQIVHSTVEEVVMQFPKTKEKFYAELRKEGVMGELDEEPNWKALATTVDYREVWFTDYEKVGDEWRRVEGVCWKYKECILGKMKNPYFDYEGEEKLFTYEDPSLESTKRQLSYEEMQMSLVTGEFPPFVEQEQVYHNYFQMPRKPFFFMTYDQWGKQPLDETSRIEQNIKNQQSYDGRNKQIIETLDQRGHHVWSKESGLNAADVQKMDHNNPDEDYLVSGNVKEVHDFVQAERPDQAEFADLDRTQQRMYAIAGSSAIRGEIESDVATTNQIARESNYTRADDLVEDTINPAAEWMAVWALQMIKTRYTKEHFRKILGKKGEVIFLKLHQDLVEDGMEVMIKASGTDKMKRQNNAMEMAKMKLTDPLSFFEDMDMDDPEGRTARLITFNSAMPLYLSAFVETGPTATPELIAKLQAITMSQQAAQPMGQPGMPPGAPGQPPGGPQGPSAQDTGAVPVSPPPQAPPQGSPRVL